MSVIEGVDDRVIVNELVRIIESAAGLTALDTVNRVLLVLVEKLGKDVLTKRIDYIALALAETDAEAIAEFGLPPVELPPRKG